MLSIVLTQAKERPPPGAAISERGSSLFSALRPMNHPSSHSHIWERCCICSDRQYNGENAFHFSQPPVQERAARPQSRSEAELLCQSDTICSVWLIRRQHSLGDLSVWAYAPPAPPEGEPLASGSRSGFSFVQPLSLASLDSSPSRGASGEDRSLCGDCQGLPSVGEVAARQR